MKITDDVEKILKHYVYVYIDPTNKIPFYIGRGRGNRVFSHLEDDSDSEKVKRILKIGAKGKKPQIEILRYGLSESEAALVEAATIDLIGKANLTNQISGHHKTSFGRIALQEFLSVVAAKPIKVQHKTILITINKLYRSGMTSEELYEATRGIWKLGKDREKAEYAMSVYQGVVREVYRIEKWYPAGTMRYRTRSEDDVNDPRRWEFKGKVATDIRDQYIGRSVGKSGQFPVRYVNIKKK